MSEKLRGAPVAAALNEKTAAAVAGLSTRGIVPGLAILRVGVRPDDIAYEQSAERRCAALGIAVRRVTLPAGASQEALTEAIERLNADDTVHGILLLRPLPEGLDEKAAVGALAPEKDVDGVTGVSLAGVFTGSGAGFPPCTARSCMEILRHYGVPVAGKRAVVLGRSLVIGRPIAAMLLAADATVTVCHSKTADIPALCRAADIVVAATGRPESVGREHLSKGQVVLDVGMSWSEKKQKLCGDVDPDAAELTGAFTPVPGGVGTVTAAVLAAHVAEAAERIKPETV